MYKSANKISQAKAVGLNDTYIRRKDLTFGQLPCYFEKNNNNNIMTQNRYEVEDNLRGAIKKQKRIANNVSLILIVWMLLILLGLFLSNSHPEIQESIRFFGLLSIIPLGLLEIIIVSKLKRVKKDKLLLKERHKTLSAEDDL